MAIQTIELFGRKDIKVFNERPKNIGDILSNSAKNYKEKNAIVTEERTLTYSELDSYSSIIASNLQKKCGVKKGDRVAIIIGNRYHFPLFVFACAKLGAILVPVNVKLAAEEIAFILGHSDVKVIISEEKFIYKMDEIKEIDSNVIPHKDLILVIDGEDTFTQLMEDKYELEKVKVDELDSVFILYTSGTTGKPKGAVLTHINVIHSLINYKTTFKTDSTMKTLIAVPMFHVTGLVAQLLHILFVGGTAHSMERYQNDKYIETILKYRINFLFNVPTIFIMMSTQEKFQNNSFDFVTKVAFGGAPIYQQTFSMLRKAFPNAEMHNAYGATETTSPATLMPLTYSEEKVTSVGLSVPVADIKIINTKGDECKLHEVGELYIKGPMVIKEYWKNIEANKSNFLDGYWLSGDLGCVDEDGFFYIRDRKKHMINRGGEKIFSIEVEDVLKKYELINEAAVIGIPDPLYGEKVKAFIVSDQLTEEDIPKIKNHCKKNLAKFKIPEVYAFIDELPRNASGKILKQSLKEKRGN
ncbi:class I adenylate-forming enzyme family protein [Virgibacillus byunsanensis]|uniref:Class I adenylate-forming enzyme family protein n=1 Tax=Virgibacillus byunsanensis TaxID=570945 RepID=A0ABW3LQB5_9BACI